MRKAGRSCLVVGLAESCHREKAKSFTVASRLETGGHIVVDNKVTNVGVT